MAETLYITMVEAGWRGQSSDHEWPKTPKHTVQNPFPRRTGPKTHSEASGAPAPKDTQTSQPHCPTGMVDENVSTPGQWLIHSLKGGNALSAHHMPHPELRMQR